MCVLLLLWVCGCVHVCVCAWLCVLLREWLLVPQVQLGVICFSSSLSRGTRSITVLVKHTLGFWQFLQSSALAYAAVDRSVLLPTLLAAVGGVTLLTSSLVSS